MKHRVGDRVAFKRDDAFISNHACDAWGVDSVNTLIFKDCKFCKGTITKVKTSFMFFFKFRDPVYVIDDHYITKHIKPLITVKAQ